MTQGRRCFMRAALGSALVFAATGCGGCGDRLTEMAASTSSYGMREAPMCVGDDTTAVERFKSNYGFIVKSGPYMHAGPLRMAGSMLDGVQAVGEMRVAIIDCGKKEPGTVDASKPFDDDHVPEQCSGQKVLVNEVVEAQQDDRSKALKRTGFFRFPEAKGVACTVGKLSQEDGITLGQKIEDLHRSVEAHIEVANALPKSLAELKKERNQPDLPKDPWGSELVFEVKGNRISLTSPGPDKKLGTGDDEELYHYEAEPDFSGGASGHSYNVGDSPSYADYDEWLAKQSGG